MHSRCVGVCFCGPRLLVAYGNPHHVATGAPLPTSLKLPLLMRWSLHGREGGGRVAVGSSARGTRAAQDVGSAVGAFERWSRLGAA